MILALCVGKRTAESDCGIISTIPAQRDVDEHVWRAMSKMWRDSIFPPARSGPIFR
ncbi:hypothetical protein F9288_18530 [Sphingomonas sp. CL5.1]|uniref:hypothetical protein n=1 Tax=Sphingomonas sp. CL5.1 TaxID=2653203 RepID=UPI001583884F|nr:hypothetical protein [Sphingomonas sp. CL5.1]QKS01395.1 hypothetical protein F9288_18530 [Sphingomonas sp. CL5.1]